MVGIQARMASGVDGDFFVRQEDNSLGFAALKKLLMVAMLLMFVVRENRPNV